MTTPAEGSISLHISDVEEKNEYERLKQFVQVVCFWPGMRLGAVLPLLLLAVGDSGWWNITARIVKEVGDRVVDGNQTRKPSR